MTQETKFKQSELEKQLVELKEKDVIKRIRPDKGGYWKVLK